MLFRATLALASIAGAFAIEAYDLEVKVAVDDEDFTIRQNPTLANIPCGGSRTIKFKVNFHSNIESGGAYGQSGDLTYILKDIDGDNPWSSPIDNILGDTHSDGIIEKETTAYDGDKIISFEFSCSTWDEGCVLDYKGDTGIDGEKSSYAFLKVEYLIPSDDDDTADEDTTTTYFDVGCQANPVVKDDPHFKGWSGKWYDYMGECDLVFIDAPFFTQDTPMNINIRTKIRYDYSYIESAVIRIGEETFEVGSWGEYFLNGVEGAKLPATISGYKITKTEESEKVHKFQIEIDDDEVIEFKTYKDWVSVGFQGIDHSRYSGATGMMGNHDKYGKLVGRDGVTPFTDMDAFANEWQVRPEEPMLFHSARLPQAPQQCVTPSASTTSQRRLGETLAYEAAEAACAKAGWSKTEIEMCIHDVMATGDLELATVGAM